MGSLVASSKIYDRDGLLRMESIELSVLLLSLHLTAAMAKAAPATAAPSAVTTNLVVSDDDEDEVMMNILFQNRNGL